tara:strand:- start:28 stop:432 length:405 start_codon:yes stop_codon:yes gene_type:complete
MKKNNYKIFNDSFERCVNDVTFIDHFYRLFIDSSDEIRQKFKNTEMALQKEMLLKSLSYIMMANKRPDILSKIATRHDSKNLDIEPQLYENWLNCMVEAVKLTDKRFDEDVEESWRAVMQLGIDYMVSKYPGDE